MPRCDAITHHQLEHHNENVESLVDDIVGTYYNGFNKAIHHYSDILVLFSDAKEQVDVLREALEVARKRLGSSSTSLQSTVRAAVVHCTRSTSMHKHPLASVDAEPHPQ